MLQASRMAKKSFKTIYWRNTLFLMGTLLTALTAVPLYLWHFGLNAFQICLFMFFFISTGMSITLGYHRLFSHITFKAKWPVRLYTLLFGAAAFESSALTWCADHRRHHKFVDHDDDPYDITKGFFHAHIGWLLFRQGPETPLTWVRDLQRDPMLRWQHDHYVPIAMGMGFVLPAALGYLWGGWVDALGAFLLAGVLRVVFVHHMTFCINSLCHWIGRQPYSTRCSAKDSGLMAIFTFGEGYHNYHHEFQHDYRNGVKPWQFDPTKWTIWALARVGLVCDLRTVAEEKILRAEIAEHQRHLQEHLDAPATDLSPSVQEMITTTSQKLHEALAVWEGKVAHYRDAAEKQLCQKTIKSLKQEVREAQRNLDDCLSHWKSVLRSFAEMRGTAAVL